MHCKSLQTFEGRLYSAMAVFPGTIPTTCQSPLRFALKEHEMPDNLWGTLPDVSNLRTPYTVLREQAAALTEMTKGSLVGEVTMNQESQNISLTLRIRAPALSNYIYVVLHARHTLSLYPVQFWGPGGGFVFVCSSEDDFKTKLGAFLKSDEVRKVVGGL